MTAALKEKEIHQPEPDLDSLEDAELVRIIYENSRGSIAQRAWHAYMERQTVRELKNSMEKSRFAETRKLGQQQRRTNAEMMRDYWKKSVIHAHLAGYVKREELIPALVKATAGRGFKGKGGSIREGTVRRWLTDEMYDELGKEANALREQGVTSDSYDDYLHKQQQ